MQDLLSSIRRVKEHNARLFAYPIQLSNSIIRWVDEQEPEHYNRNFFQTVGAVTTSDLDKLTVFQKEQNLRGFILKSEEPLPRELVECYDLSEERQFIFIGKETGNWKTNPSVSIKDCQNSDIAAELIDSAMSLSNHPQLRDFLRRAMEECLAVAKSHPEYHWLAAYIDGKLVGRCYALVVDGFVQMEDLWVHPSQRRQHIATTLLEYINQRFIGQLFFHVEEGSKAIAFYENLGFRSIASVYEYQKEWEL